MMSLSFFLWSMKTFMDMARMNPFAYSNAFDISFACTTIPFPPFLHSLDLQNASEAQLQYVLDPECEMEHSTCPKYCDLYGDCSMSHRVLFYCPTCWAVSENMMKGVRDPLRAFHLFLEREGHCQNIFSVDHNALSIAFHEHPNLIIQNLARIPTLFFAQPFVSGTHRVLNETHAQFFVNYIDTPTSILLSIACPDSQDFEMSMFLYPHTYALTLFLPCTEFGYSFRAPETHYVYEVPF